MTDEERAELETYRAITRRHSALIESRLKGLEDRVAELERTAVKRDMANGLDYEQVHPFEMTRLRRIEQLAARLLESSCPMGDAVRAANWERLAKAVDRR